MGPRFWRPRFQILAAVEVTEVVFGFEEAAGAGAGVGAEAEADVQMYPKPEMVTLQLQSSG